MANRTKPFLFIATLVVVLMFIVGFRSGQQVEKRNKEIDFIISLTPAPSATPTITPTPKTLGYKTYVHKQCGVQLVLPTSLQKTKETSNSAKFEELEEVRLALSCDKKDPFTKALNENKTATGVGRLNPITGRRTYFFVSKDLLPLLTNTLKFVAN